MFGGGYNQRVTHQPVLDVNPFLIPQHVMTNVRDYYTGVCDIALNLGNDSVRLCDTTDIGNGSMGASLRRRQ